MKLMNIPLSARYFYLVRPVSIISKNKIGIHMQLLNRATRIFISLTNEFGGGAPCVPSAGTTCYALYLLPYE